MQVFSAIFKDLTALEKKRFNSSAISVSSLRISSFSMSFIFLSKVLLFVKKWFYYFPKSLIIGYNRCIEIVKKLFFPFL